MTAGYHGGKAVAAIRLRVQVGQVEPSEGVLRSPPTCSQNLLKRMAAALVSPGGGQPTDLMGVSPRGGVVVGRFDGPDDPPSNSVRGWGPVTPEETEETVTILEAPGQANVKAQTLDGAKPLVRGGRSFLRRKSRYKEGGRVMARQGRLREETSDSAEPGPLRGEAQVSGVPREGLELRTPFAGG